LHESTIVQVMLISSYDFCFFVFPPMINDLTG